MRFSWCADARLPDPPSRSSVSKELPGMANAARRGVQILQVAPALGAPAFVAALLVCSTTLRRPPPTDDPCNRAFALGARVVLVPVSPCKRAGRQGHDNDELLTRWRAPVLATSGIHSLSATAQP